MGCGSSGSATQTYPHDAVVLESRLSVNQMDFTSIRQTTQSTIFLEDVVDDERAAKNLNGRNVIHYDTVKLIDFMINAAKNDRDKAQAYVFKADRYFKHASDLRMVQNLENYRTYRKALSVYTVAHQLDRNNINAIVGVAKSYVSLYQYTKPLRHLSKAYKRHKVELCKLSEFWYLYGLCQRKCARKWNNFRKSERAEASIAVARKFLQEGLNNFPKNEQLVQESQVVDRVINTQNVYRQDFTNYIDYMKHVSNTYTDMCTRKRKSDREMYKILSIDGGTNAQGIIPTMMLCEIEKRCKKCLPNLFDLFIGASIGAVVNCAVAIPKAPDSLKLLYTVSQPLEILLNQTDVIGDTFKNFYLSQTIADVIIPCVNYDEQSLKTIYYTSYGVKQAKQKDILIRDVLRSTTAIQNPKYCPPYKIQDLESFFDCVLTLGTPCKKAYEEAVYSLHKNPDNIFMVSLGTGINTLDMYTHRFTNNKDILQSGSNIPQSIVIEQSHDVHLFMKSRLANRYKRFQVYYETEEVVDVTDFIEITTEYVEEKHDEINSIVEILLNN